MKVLKGLLDGEGYKSLQCVIFGTQRVGRGMGKNFEFQMTVFFVSFNFDRNVEKWKKKFKKKFKKNIR